MTWYEWENKWINQMKWNNMKWTEKNRTENEKCYYWELLAINLCFTKQCRLVRRAALPAEKTCESLHHDYSSRMRRAYPSPSRRLATSDLNNSDTSLDRKREVKLLLKKIDLSPNRVRFIGGCNLSALLISVVGYPIISIKKVKMSSGYSQISS